MAAVTKGSEAEPITGGEPKPLSVRRLMVRRFLRNRMAMIGAAILICLYTIIAFPSFFAPYDFDKGSARHVYIAPQALLFFDQEGRFHFRPFVYPLEGKRDRATMRIVYTPDLSDPQPIRFLVRGYDYSMFFGLLESDLQLFGVERGTIHLLGTDGRGRDMLSRIIAGGRVSLTVGLLGIAIMVFLGTAIGTLSAYWGGWFDTVTQRFIELIRTFPQLPLWMALAAVLPPHWPSVWVFFGITIVLAMIEWTGLAREIRGKVMSMKTADFIAAAEVAGAGTGRIIFVHLVPNLSSHILVTATLAVPTIILGESALSFLGLGIRPPMTSWGVLLSDANKIEIFRLYPWLLTPALALVLTVMSFNFLGDGLRDVADPFTSR